MIADDVRPLLTTTACDIITAGSYGKLVANVGTPASAHKLLDDITPDRLFAAPIKNWAAAYASLAGLWLWHDALHECHAIVQKRAADLIQAAPLLHQTPLKATQGVGLQSMESGTGIKDDTLELMDQALAFWHGIMHRREGDFSNSHYWFRRAGKHPAMKQIEDYDAHSFIDEVDAAHQRGEAPTALIDKQRREWVGLFEWCVSQS